MKTIIAVAIIAAVAAASVHAALISLSWDIETSAATPVVRELVRGETVNLIPRFLSNRSPVSLTNVYEVVMRYRSADMASNEFYVASGSVHNAAAGQVRILWSPANEAAAAIYQYTIAAKSSGGEMLRGFGTIRLIGSVSGDQTNQIPKIATVYDWDLITEHRNPEAAPFLGPADLLEVTQRLDGHDADIEDLTALVGTGVQGVQDALDAHMSTQAGVDAAQDAQIQLALDSATMGKDVTGPSTNATVVALQGRPLPPINEAPANNQAMIWDSALGRWAHRLVDLSPIQAAISNLVATAATVGYVDTEISRVEGLVDGNDHALQRVEEFASADWLEIANNVWQHNTWGWLASGAIIINDELRLLPDIGTITMDLPQHVSRVTLTGPASPYLIGHAATVLGPYSGYDPVKNNILATNQFAIRMINTGGTQAIVSRIEFYSWTHPERVGATRDFTGLKLRVDTPTGTDIREAANVQYVRTLAATGSISGTFGTGFTVDRFKSTPISTAGLLNGMGLIYYSSVNEFRPVDLATQFELDAGLALKTDATAHDNLASRVAATEAGGIAISGDVVGGHLQTTSVHRIRGVEIDQPAGDQYSPVYDIATGRIMWRSILSSNAVYAVGSNDVYSLPPQAAGFYRSLYGTNAIMPLVVDHQILGWLGKDGLTIPYGTLHLMQSNLTANVRLYDGSAAVPALATQSDPATGWYRPGAHVWRYVAAGNLVADFSAGGITMQPGKTVMLADGSRAVSLAEIEDGIVLDEQDPLSIHRSSTTQTWTHAGGSYTTEQVIATSTLLSNGVASVSYDLAAGSGLQVAIEMSDLNLTTWEPFVAFSTPGYVRVALVEVIPGPIDPLTTVSNIAARSWTRPDLVGVVRDTAGQIIHVDAATQPRQPVQLAQLAQLQTAVSGVTPAAWSQYPATQTVHMAGNKLLLGGGWSVIEVEGVGVVSYLVIANNGTPALTAHAGLAGLHIEHFTLDGGTATVGVATNGVASDPIIQWTESLMLPDWQPVAPDATSYPDTTTNGWYEYVVTLPGPAGFVRAVRESGDARVETHAPLYEMGHRVATTSQVAAAEVRLDVLEALPSFVWSGTNLLIVADGVTNRVMLEAWIDE